MKKLKLKKLLGVASVILFVLALYITKDLTEAVPLIDYDGVMPSYRLSVHGIDIGQGAATLIKTKKTSVLIDTGERNNADDLLNYLKGEGVKELDYLFITHPHKDHYGAVCELLEKVKVKKAYLPQLPFDMEADGSEWEESIRALSYKGVSVFYPEEKESFPLGTGAYLELLGPFLKDAKNLNDLSLCFKLKCGDVSFLITGDGEKAVERALMKEDIKSDILFSGHHGSKTSSNDFFVDKVMPQASLISVGLGNSHGLPDRVHLDNLLKWGDIFRTDTDGSVVFLTDGRNIKAVTEK